MVNVILLVTALLLLLLLLIKFGSARLRESDIHPISPKTPAPQYQPIDRIKRMGKIEDYSRDRAAYGNKEALAPLLFLYCWSHARVFGKTLVHEFLISYSHIELSLLFSRQCNYKCTMCMRREKLEIVKH